MQKPDGKKFVLATLLASAVTVLFSFLGAPLLRVIHNVFGSKLYWGAGVVVTGVLLLLGPVLGPLTFGVWLTVGLYGELENRGRAGFGTALGAVLFGSAFSLGVPAVYARMQGLEITVLLKQVFSQLSQMVIQSSGPTAPKIEVDLLIALLPSLIIVLNMLALGFALILDRRMGLLLGLRFERVASQIKLLDFKLPDAMIWIMMISFLLSFVKLDNDMISIVAQNVFICAMGAYLFQGLAVFEVALLVFQVGYFLRAAIYILIVGQFFILLSGIGIIDYWVDFRGRMRKWRQSKSNPKNGERV